MSQFAWPFYGFDLTNTIREVWNITDNYAEQASSALLALLDYDYALQIYNPNSEDWYEIYYGVEIDPEEDLSVVIKDYDEHISKIKDQFKDITYRIQERMSDANVKKLFEALDVTNLSEAKEMFDDLRDWIIDHKPSMVAVFSF